jgi:hypothetical protein
MPFDFSPELKKRASPFGRFDPDRRTASPARHPRGEAGAAAGGGCDLRVDDYSHCLNNPRQLQMR